MTAVRRPWEYTCHVHRTHFYLKYSETGSNQCNPHWSALSLVRNDKKEGFDYKITMTGVKCCIFVNSLTLSNFKSYHRPGIQLKNVEEASKETCKGILHI